MSRLGSLARRPADRLWGMSEYSEWAEERHEYGWFGRLIAPRDGGRPATLAFMIGALGVVAFGASLILEWQSVTVTVASLGVESNSQQTISVSMGGPMRSTELLGLVYVAGVIAILGLWGATVARPDLAARTRLA